MNEQRKYSVAEIEGLRRVLRNEYIWGNYHGHTAGRTQHRAVYAAEMDRAVEEQVRTHMLAGHTSNDLLESERGPN